MKRVSLPQNKKIVSAQHKIKGLEPDKVDHQVGTFLKRIKIRNLSSEFR